ncbi:MAG: hypothetical protein ACNA78_05205 [Balneolaceae bacterium]
MAAILSVGGLAGVGYYTYKYFEETESYDVLGADVTISTGDWVPILISALVLVVGLLMYRK